MKQCLLCPGRGAAFSRRCVASSGTMHRRAGTPGDNGPRISSAPPQRVEDARKRADGAAQHPGHAPLILRSAHLRASRRMKPLNARATQGATHMILITGAGGKTGKAIARALLARGAPVRAFVRSAAHEA